MRVKSSKDVVSEDETGRGAELGWVRVMGLIVDRRKEGLWRGCVIYTRASTPGSPPPLILAIGRMESGSVRRRDEMVMWSVVIAKMTGRAMSDEQQIRCVTRYTLVTTSEGGRGGGVLESGIAWQDA